MNEIKLGTDNGGFTANYPKHITLDFFVIQNYIVNCCNFELNVLFLCGKKYNYKSI